MTRRAVLWAGVSSRPQATEEKDSLPSQLAEGEALALREGWTVTARLQVPGATRSYVDLADAVTGLRDDLRRLGLDIPNAYEEIERLIGERAFDVLVVRSRDRLGRTDSLIAGIEERMRRMGAEVYSLAMPPTGSTTGDIYTSAIERARARDELVEFVRRTRYGMDARARKGLPVGPVLPFGYRLEYTLSARPQRTAVVDPVEAAAWQGMAADVLDRGVTYEALAEQLQGQFPERQWPISALYGLLRNPFYAGLVLRKRARNAGETAALVVLAPDGPSILDDALWPEAEALLARRAARDRVENADGTGRRRVYLLAPGQHEALIDLARWLALQREMEHRADARRAPAQRSLWSGMARCGVCGSPMHFSATRRYYRDRVYLHAYYRCSQRDKRRGWCDNPPITQEAVTSGVVRRLAELYAVLAAEVNAGAVPEPERLDLLAGLEKQVLELGRRRDRLVLLFETGRVDLEAFDRRDGELQRALDVAAGRLAEERAAVRETEGRRERRALVGELLPNLAERLAGAEPVRANRWLREMIGAVVVAWGEVTEVRMR